MSRNNLRTQLENRMFDSFASVNESKNIVLKDLNYLSQEQLIYILTQYSQFPRNIVSILVSAAYNFGYYEWTDFVNELRDNIFQELGGGSGNIASEFGPHYSILRKEMQNVFNVDISKSKSSPATVIFLDSMKLCVESEPFKAAGSVFALEASAIPELTIVMKLTSHLAKLGGQKLTQNLENFFRFHMDIIEVEHRDHLLKLVDDKLSEPSNFKKFLEGYDAVLQSMDAWWEELNRETQIRENKITDSHSFVSHTNISHPELHQ